MFRQNDMWMRPHNKWINDENLFLTVNLFVTSVFWKLWLSANCCYGYHFRSNSLQNIFILTKKTSWIVITHPELTLLENNYL